MKQKIWIIALLVFTLLGCQLTSRMANPVTTQQLATAQLSATVTLPKRTLIPSETPLPLVTVTPRGEPLNFVVADWGKLSFYPLATFQPSQPYDQSESKLPIILKNTLNPEVIAGLTADQLTFLANNGFIVLESGDQQFKDIRQQTALVNGQPYFLTTDAAYHALHITFNDFLQALEKEALRPVMGRLLRALDEQIIQYLSTTAGTSIEEDALLAHRYLAVAIKLFDPTAEFDAETETAIAAQLAQIVAENGKQYSALIPGFEDDYGAYRPVGHYAGTPELEQYFHGMTWLGRVAFHFQNANDPQLQASRAPLIITLALREAKVGNRAAYQLWSDIYSMLDFLIGPSDDPGPLELNGMMEIVFGELN